MSAMQPWVSPIMHAFASPILVLVSCTEASQKSYLVLLETASRRGGKFVKASMRIESNKPKLLPYAAEQPQRLHLWALPQG